MENKQNEKESKCMRLLMWEMLACAIVWFVLILLRAAEVIHMHWALVLSGIVWISWGVYGLTALVVAILTIIRKEWLIYQHRRKVDARIRAEAERLGVWDQPNILGGRALELYAWNKFRIKRKIGETDPELRRYIAMIEQERKRKEEAQNE